MASHAQRFLLVVVVAESFVRLLLAVIRIVGHIKVDHDGRQKQIKLMILNLVWLSKEP